MAGDNGDIVGQREKRFVNRSEELLGVAAGEIGPAYRASEEGISRQYKVLLWQVKADAAFGVAGGMEDGPA